jgi:hypothetical protein
MLKIFKGTKDLSITLENYISGEFTETLAVGEFFHIGYYKPIDALYLETVSQNEENNLVVEFYDGTSWNILSTIDKTFGLKKSGFVTWARNIETQVENSVNGVQLYWYRLSIDTNDITDLTVKGINLVFSDDNDLKESYPGIMEYLPDGSTSFISFHLSARNHILTYLRNKGKSVSTLGVRKLLDQFDLHNYEEVKQASKYKALATIFYNESDNVDDKWYQKAKDFDRLYSESISLNFLSLDENNDGKEEPDEVQSLQYIKIQRL